jgi:hypothetical protein
MTKSDSGPCVTDNDNNNGSNRNNSNSDVTATNTENDNNGYVRRLLTHDIDELSLWPLPIIDMVIKYYHTYNGALLLFVTSIGYDDQYRVCCDELICSITCDDLYHHYTSSSSINHNHSHSRRHATDDVTSV